MLIYFAALLAAAAVLFGLQPKREANRWAALFLLFASLGGLAGWLRETRLSIPLPPGGVDPAEPLLSAAAIALELANHTLTPYGVLVFAIVYASRVSPQTRHRLKLLLPLPAAATAAILLLSDNLQLPFPFVLGWAGPYYLASCWLLAAGALREKHAARRKEKTAVAILTIPTLLAILLFINIAMVFAPAFPFFRYVSFFIAYSLLVGTAFAFGSGVLGVKVRVERDPLESAVKAVSSGTAMLNHTIKNEIAKISMSTDTIRASLNQPDKRNEAMEQLELISRSTDHMLSMVARIHGQTKEIQLLEAPERLTLLADESLEQHATQLDGRAIIVRKDYQADPIVRCDGVHMREVFANLIRNAIEAMPGGGRLRIQIRELKHGAEISFQDNGAGMSKEKLALALEPFFTTKGAAGNFGLGLTYCYKVMQQSGGSIAIQSKPQLGTTVTLTFPPQSKRKEARQ